VSSGDTLERTQLRDRAALRTLLARYFGIDMPEVDRLRVPSVPEWT
jgi:N-hydroxyarylamine O-acetyltransferase